MAYPMFPLVSLPHPTCRYPSTWYSASPRSPWPTPGAGGLTVDEIRHLNLPCGSYGYESEAVDAWLDELAEQLGKRQLF